MEFNNKKLAGRIKERFGTQKAFASAIGVSESTVSRYLKGEHEWDGKSMIKAVRALKIPNKEIESYFFALDVAEMRKEETV